MPRRHTVLALVVAVCWAVNFVVIDIGLESFPPLLFVALRFGLIAFPAIFFVARPDVRWPAVVAVGLFICVGQFGLLFVAMDTGLPAGLASVIAPLQPVFTIPLAAVALGERPSVHQVAGVSLAVAGIGAIAAGRAHGVPLRAVAIGIASAASWGCGNVVTRAAGTKRPFSLLVWSSAVAPVPLLGLSLIFEGSARWQSAASSINASGIAALGYVVIVSTFFGYGVWYRLMSRHPASTVAPFTLLVPAVGIFTAWLVRGEHPTSGELIGAAIVVVGLALALGLGDTFTLQRATREDSMAGLEHRDFSAPDETRTPDKTTVDLVNVGGGQIGRFTFQPGWRWSECIKPVAGTDSCQVEHIGYAVSGSLHVKHDDGTEGDVVAGQVYRIAAGHDAWNTGNEPAVFVEFQGAANYARGQ